MLTYLKRLLGLALLAATSFAQITVIQGTDPVSSSRTTINNNFSYLDAQGKFASAKVVRMVHDAAGVWTVADPNGTAINIAGSTCQGLPEAIAYAHTNGYSLVVDGGGVLPPPGNQDRSLLTCTAPLSIPTAHNNGYRFYNVDLKFTGSASSDFITFDSADDLTFEFEGQIIYSGNAAAVRFLATNDNGESYIGVTSSSFHVHTIAIVNAGTLAPESTHGIGVRLSATNGAIINSSFDFLEINGGLTGIQIDNPAGGLSVNLNQFKSTAFHGQGTAGVLVGTSAGAAGSIYGNEWDMQLNPTSGAVGVDVWGGQNDGNGTGGDFYRLSIAGGSIGVRLNSSAVKNTFLISRNAATTRITDNSTLKDNLFVEPWQRGTGVPAMNCYTGQMFFRTDATAGSNIYGCTSPNVWTLQSGSGTGTGRICTVVRSTTTLLTVAGNASASTPCIVGPQALSYTSSKTFTISAASGAAFVYVLWDGTGGITLGHNGLTVTTSGGTVTSGITAYPQDSIPLATVNATSGTWDVTVTTTEPESFGFPHITSTNLAITRYSDHVNIEPPASSLDLTDVSVLSLRGFIGATGYGASHLGPWGTTGDCSGAVPVTTGVGAGLPAMVQQQAATTKVCVSYMPGYENATTFPFIDFVSGGTPKNYKFQVYYERETAAATGDHFIGFCQSVANWSNCVGLRYDTVSAKWKCVIVSGAADVVATDTGVTPDITPHWFRVYNGGTANSVTCQIGSATATTVTGTVPVGNVFAVVGARSVAGNTPTYSAGEYNLYITGRTSN